MSPESIQPAHGRLRRCHALALLLILTTVSVCLPTARPAVLDRLDEVDAWQIQTADGVEAEVARDQGHDGMGMRLDFDFHGSGGFLIARRPVKLSLPENYSISFYLRGKALPNNLEIKLIGPRGENVWWSRKRNFEFPEEWRKITVKKRHFSKAWGPSDEPLREISAIEIAISAGMGGKGSVWLDELELVERPVTARPPMLSSTE
jgi:hypothetical protein